MLWQFFSLPGIENGIEYRYFSRYRIEVRNSSIVTTLPHPPGGDECESVKEFTNDGSLAKALSCKVEFIYSARKIVHSEEYIKKGK